MSSIKKEEGGGKEKQKTKSVGTRVSFFRQLSLAAQRDRDSPFYFICSNLARDVFEIRKRTSWRLQP